MIRSILMIHSWMRLQSFGNEVDVNVDDTDESGFHFKSLGRR